MANRRVQDDALTTETGGSSSSLRIRHFLLMCVVVGVGYGLFPRAKAAWTLHDRASAMADYALCMVGPMGPATFRDRPAEFAKLLRMRLLVSKPEAKPFEKCGPLALEAAGSPNIAAAHAFAAVEFVEYGGPPVAAKASVKQLIFSANELSPLAKRAWPFERKGYSRLIRPSLVAKEALHPVPFPQAASGVGIPGWRTEYRTSWAEGKRWLMAFGRSSALRVLESTDGGLAWTAVSLNQPGLASHAGRCRASASQTQVSFTVVADESGTYLNSFYADDRRSALQLVGAKRVLSMACDETSALLAIEGADGQRRLLSCDFGAKCQPVPLSPSWIAEHFDIARVAGVTVVATVVGGIVRVRSSRDKGRSWTPATVAFDWQSQVVKTDVKLPNRLIALNRRLFLYGAGAEGESYPVLLSDDFGASWRTPTAPTEARLPGQAQR